jgi:hypothetical protein
MARSASEAEARQLLEALTTFIGTVGEVNACHGSVWTTAWQALEPLFCHPTTVALPGLHGARGAHRSDAGRRV